MPYYNARGDYVNSPAIRFNRQVGEPVQPNAEVLSPDDPFGFRDEVEVERPPTDVLRRRFNSPEVPPAPPAPPDPFAPVLEQLRPYLPYLTDEQLDDLVDAYDLDGAVGILSPLAIDELERQLDVQATQAGLDLAVEGRNRNVGDLLYATDRAAGQTDEQFAARGLGSSGFRIQAQTDLNRLLDQRIAAQNRELQTSFLTAQRGLLNTNSSAEFQTQLDAQEDIATLLAEIEANR